MILASPFCIDSVLVSLLYRSLHPWTILPSPLLHHHRAPSIDSGRCAGPCGWKAVIRCLLCGNQSVRCPFPPNTVLALPPVKSKSHCTYFVQWLFAVFFMSSLGKRFFIVVAHRLFSAPWIVLYLRWCLIPDKVRVALFCKYATDRLALICKFLTRHVVKECKGLETYGLHFR